MIATPNRLGAPKALPVGELITGFRTGGEDLISLDAEPMAALLRVLRSSRTSPHPEPPPKSQRLANVASAGPVIRVYSGTPGIRVRAAPPPPSLGTQLIEDS